MEEALEEVIIYDLLQPIGFSEFFKTRIDEIATTSLMQDY